MTKVAMISELLRDMGYGVGYPRSMRQLRSNAVDADCGRIAQGFSDTNAETLEVLVRYVRKLKEAARRRCEKNKEALK